MRCPFTYAAGCWLGLCFELYRFTCPIFFASETLLPGNDEAYTDVHELVAALSRLTTQTSIDNQIYPIEVHVDKRQQQLFTDFLIYYPGDHGWQNYVSALEQDWEKRNDKEMFLSLLKDRELAVVISYHFDSSKSAFEWFENSDIPAFKGLGSPKDLVLSGSDGMNFVRTVLMRFP